MFSHICKRIPTCAKNVSYFTNASIISLTGFTFKSECMFGRYYFSFYVVMFFNPKVIKQPGTNVIQGNICSNQIELIIIE